MKVLMVSLFHWLDQLFVDQNSLESYLRGASSLAELESRQIQWERTHGHGGLFA